MMTLFKTLFRRLPVAPSWRFSKMTLADTGVDADVLAAAVRRTELFCNAGEPLVRAMLAIMRVRPVRRGERILRQGERSDRFVLLAAGCAEVTRMRENGRGECSLAVLREPSGLGEEALLGAEIRGITVTMQTDGVALEIRRADFSRLISARGVKWLTPEAVETEAQPPAAWLWAGTAKSRPRRMGADALAIPLDQLRERLSDLDPQRHYLCGGREDGSGALAAFLLAQRGFNASAVRAH